VEEETAYLFKWQAWCGSDGWA